MAPRLSEGGSGDGIPWTESWVQGDRRRAIVKVALAWVSLTMCGGCRGTGKRCFGDGGERRDGGADGGLPRDGEVDAVVADVEGALVWVAQRQVHPRFSSVCLGQCRCEDGGDWRNRDEE
uniref:Uncharacterized protein n=1 Tax=Oryza rufipogon TaxID=4529 RepID=A0A0E0P566_ORYRU